MTITNEKLKVGVAGLGTVGAATVRILLSKPEKANVLAVSAQNKQKDRGFPLDDIQWFEDPLKLAAHPDINVFVELIGGDEGTALDAVNIALDNGKHVVTANKALLAKHGMMLAQKAQDNGVILRFEAAIAGGIPVVKALREGLKANTITRVIGILNGTCNYMLTRMGNEGLSFDECLKIAQDLGYAEADPTFDIGGFDAAHKISLLSTLAFGHEIAADHVMIEGIEAITSEDINIAHDLGYKIKLLGIAQKTNNGIEQRVHPTLVPESSDIARVDGVLNAVAIEGDYVGKVMLVGPGAGGDATGSAMVGDILDIAYGDTSPTYGFTQTEMMPFKAADMMSHQGGFYIRFEVRDEIGVFAYIAKIMAEFNISLNNIMQNAYSASSSDENTDISQTVVMITHICTENALRNAVAKIQEKSFVIGKAQVIRIESF